jgi:hypothetical protein
MTIDAEKLTNMSLAELEALAEGMLAPARQARLDDLLAKNGERPLTGAEEQELDHLLALTDQLMLLKARARYTLGQFNVGATTA